MADQEIAVVLRLLASQFQAEAKKSQGLLGDFMGAVRSWQVQLAATAGALLAIAKSTANYGEEALKAAQKTNTSVESITALRHSANLADVPFEQMTNAMGRLSRTAFEAASGTKESQRAFQLLGIEVQTAEGRMRPTEQLLLELADRIKRTGVSGQEAAALTAIFSRGYQELIPWLIQGKDAIQAQMESAKRLGIVFSEEDAVAFAKFNEKLKELQATLRGLVTLVGLKLIPIMTDLAKVILDLATGKQGTGLDEWIKGLEHSFDQLVTIMVQVIALAEAINRSGDALLGRSTEKFRGAWAEYKEILRLMDEDFERRARTRFGLGAPPPPPDVTTRDVNIGAPGPVVSPEAGAPGISRVNLDLLMAQIEASATLMRAKEMLLDFDVRLGDQARQNLTDEVGLAQARLQAAEASGASMEELAARRRAVLEAQMAQELSIADQTESQRLAIVTKYSAQIQEQRRIETGGFLEGWRIGLNKYINDYGNMLGLAVDLSRRTAALMEQAFRTFFFDLFEGRIKSFKDVLRSVLDFVKQIVAQVAAQLATVGILKLIAGPSVAPAGYGTPGGPGLQHGGRFMVTGPGSTDSQLVRFMATPGERVTVETPEQQRRSVPMGEPRIAITIRNEGEPVRGEIGSVQRDAEGWVVNVILRNLASNGQLRQAFGRR